MSIHHEKSVYFRMYNHPTKGNMGSFLKISTISEQEYESKREFAAIIFL